MQLVRYAAGGAPEWSVHRSDDIVPLSGLHEDVTVQNLSSPGLFTATEDAADAAENQSVPVEDVKSLIPIPRPGEIVYVGLNYRDHAEEQDEEVPERLLLSGKTGTSVMNPGDPIVHPAAIGEVDYEVEFGVVIGQITKNVDVEDAFDYVAGYTAISDVSGRDAQFDGGQFFHGKSCGTFTPVGPTFVPEGGVDPHDLDVTCRINSETKQESDTSEFIFGVDEVVEYTSGITTLHPGDVISTSTPGGVGIFRGPPELLGPDGSVDVEIEGIGTLTNPVISERDE